MSNHFPSRTTSHTITVFERPHNFRAELEVQAIRQNDGTELWAIFVPGGSAWTRDRNGFVPRSTISLYERRPLALWTEQEALAEAQIAAEYRLTMASKRIAHYDREHATAESLYLVADTSETAASGMTYFRRSVDGLITFVSGARRYTAAGLPVNDPTGFPVLLDTATTLAGGGNQVDAKHLAVLIGTKGASIAE